MFVVALIALLAHAPTQTTAATMSKTEKDFTLVMSSLSVIAMALVVLVAGALYYYRPWENFLDMNTINNEETKRMNKTSVGSIARINLFSQKNGTDDGNV